MLQLNLEACVCVCICHGTREGLEASIGRWSYLESSSVTIVLLLDLELWIGSPATPTALTLPGHSSVHLSPDWIRHRQEGKSDDY